MSNTNTTSQDLFSHLFEACNILRGPINQDEYKSYVTPILFFKRICDVYDEEIASALKESNGDMEYALFPENHRFIIPKGCHWNDIRNTAVNIGKKIGESLSKIETANPDNLSGVFSAFDDAVWTDKTKLSDERLKDLIEHMSKLKVGNNDYSADVMGDAYEFLIKKFADLSKKNAGEFYTPRTIVKLLVMLLDPKAGETVYDPACGTGGMLIESIRHMNNDRLSYGKIYGQEKNLSTSAIARMNLFLHGAKDFNIKQGDTLRNPFFIDGGKLKTFNCVIANPPFGLKKWGADVFSSDKYGRNIWGCPTDSNADFAWIQHMIKSMDESTGRAAVVMSQGVLFQSGLNAKIRKAIVESDLIECVISLVGGIFYGAGVSACLILLNKNKSENHKNKICLIDASKIYTALRAQNVMTIEEITKVYELYQKYEDVDEYCKIVTIDDIRNADSNFTLTVTKYIKQKEVEITPPEVIKQRYFDALEEVKASEQKLRELLLKGGYINE